jgi:hypothetical protein
MLLALFLFYAATYVFFQYISQCSLYINTSALADNEVVMKREEVSQIKTISFVILEDCGKSNNKSIE